MRIGRVIFILCLAGAVFGIDFWVKSYAAYHWMDAPPWRWLEIGPFRGDFTYVENRGTAMGFLADFPWLLTPMRLLIIAFALWMAFSQAHFRQAFAFGLVAAGGIANLCEVFRQGYVIDMIHFYCLPYSGFPVFNVADMAVSLGVLLLLFFPFTSCCSCHGSH